MRKREFPSILGDPATLNFEPGYIVQILTHPHKVSKSIPKVSFLFFADDIWLENSNQLFGKKNSKSNF